MHRNGVNAHHWHAEKAGSNDHNYMFHREEYSSLGLAYILPLCVLQYQFGIEALPVTTIMKLQREH